MHVDTLIGVLVQALDEAGILNDTLIIVTADHGGYKFVHGEFNEANMHIPALFYGPGVKQVRTPLSRPSNPMNPPAHDQYFEAARLTRFRAPQYRVSHGQSEGLVGRPRSHALGRGRVCAGAFPCMEN